ncbi:MAG: DUF2976 domain-containing protein [Proteobacteria bacterium]|uniref:DUF2976 domain-containing protein n=1 Tax=Roseateles sp. TaxID=1971397 RepID=UPI00267D0AE6|nr:DUF2976 domain-containing protein [Burkholderiaceae bacterium]MCH8857494.1 DUF2976 domain-containing protein [Pseudomonadota bacterium]
MFKQLFVSLRHRLALLADKGRSFKTTLVIGALSLMAHPAFADLPTAIQPQGVQAGDMPGLWRALLKAGVAVIVLGIGAVAFYKIPMGALKKWEEYRDGRAEIAEVKEYFIWGSIVLVAIVAILTTAASIL